MDRRRQCLLLCMICCIHYSQTEVSFVNITINNQFYFLSTNITNETYAASQCTSQLPATLAFFDTNEEYRSVAAYLASYFRDYKGTDLGVWVEIKATPSSIDNVYEHWWRHEPVDKSIWALGEPDTTCLKPSIDNCCVRITWNEFGSTFLRDKFCSDNTCYFLCKSLNECHDRTHTCSQSQVCVDKALGFDCICEDGLKLTDDGTGCEDVDECQLGHCDQECANIPRSYNCSCFSGYFLVTDGHTCQDINECDLGVCNHTCTNINGSYTCGCFPGFRLAADNSTCTDVDECAAQEMPCQQNCVNVEGTFSCNCNRGYTLMLDNKTCEVIDHCLQHPCPGPCVNTVDGYVCECIDGFEYVQSQCVDVDECTNGMHQCSHECVNTEGSYTCTCMQGYTTPTNNTHTCVDIDECADKPDICSQICLNTDGSYSCSCQNGFTLDQRDNTSCIELNECYEQTHRCQLTCHNISGSFSCSCPLGYVLQADGQSCVETSEPHECPCNCHSFLLLRAYLPEQFARETKEMQRNNSVNKVTTSLALRKKSSIQNTQTSAKAVGGSGVLIVVIFFSLIVCSDMVNVARYLLYTYDKRHGNRSVLNLEPEQS